VNPWQLAQQIKYELGLVKWSGGSKGFVFGTSVYVYAGAPNAEDRPPAFPFALVAVGSGTPDADDPDLIEQQFSIATAVEVAGDPLGELAVIGSSRADLGKSAGAGSAEVAERVRATWQALTTYDGASIAVSGSGISGSAALGEGRAVAFDEYTITALCTSAPSYTAPQTLKVAGDTWSWSGPWCSARFDFVSYTLGFKLGTTPATDAADLDGVVYTGTNTETVAAPVSGRVYHIFANYASRGTAVEGSSPVELGSFLAL